MEKKLTVGIIGATAFTGRELVKILLQHPQVQIAWMTSRSDAGKPYADSYPQFSGCLPDKMSKLTSLEDAVSLGADIVFSCLPHGASAEFLYPFIQAGSKVIDLSADFRLKDLALYEKTYNVAHPIPEFVANSVYGLVEIHRVAIQKAQIVGNPGCYPTSILLPLLPLVKNGLIEIDNTIADSKSGVSGAGRSASATTHFVNCNESITAYKIGDSHRHLSEINEQLALSGDGASQILFTPHLTPMERGILSTIYITVSPNVSKSQIEDCLKETYETAPFVQVVKRSPKTSHVSGSNQCHIHVYQPTNGDRVIICSVIDNLIKGASGQAVQNMNVMLNIPETTGLA